MYPFCQDFLTNIFRKKVEILNMKNALLRGTILLTLTGILCRILGFFYRIFLANVIGAEGMGIYQLIFPIYSICFSLCASGTETAISKLTAEKYALGKPLEALRVLFSGILLCLSLSIVCAFSIFHFADEISTIFLKEPGCASLLRILAFTIPFGTTQSCICGYYFGRHQAAIPSMAQLIEQGFRIGSVFLLYHLYVANNLQLSPAIAVIGLVFGEICSLLFTITCFTYSRQNFFINLKYFVSHSKELLSFSTPLTVSRVCINLLASLEATLLPTALKAYGMDSSTALSIYGIFTGMALPFILFPNALTSSISLMLLPEVSQFQANGQISHLKKTIHKSFSFCIILGFTCLIFFLIFGECLGNFVYSSSLAGDFITTLAWICPFLYLNTTLSSVLNGLGKTNITFINGVISLFLRIIFIWFTVPHFGIQGYLFGLLASQLFTTIYGGSFLYCTFKKTQQSSFS